MTPWERGRLARTRLGTFVATCGTSMEENPVKAGLVRFAREWRWLGGCLQEKGAGGTPALPGDDNRLLRNQPCRPG